MLYRANFRSGCQEVLCQIPYRSLSILCRHSYLCQPNLRAHQKNNAGFSHPQRLQSKPISGASPGSLHPKRCRPLGLGLQPKLPYQELVPLQRSLYDFEIKGSWSEILTPNPVGGCGRWSGVGKAGCRAALCTRLLLPLHAQLSSSSSKTEPHGPGTLCVL